MEFPDLVNGGTCAYASEYRNVVDFAGSCGDWEQAGQPLTSPTPLYCGHSLFYNEFNVGDGNSAYCGDCLTARCSSLYAACNPTDGSRCDSLVRCLRGCKAGDISTGNQCLLTYSDAIVTANAFLTCAAQFCPDCS